MMTTKTLPKFKKIQRYDVNLAMKGVGHYITDENGSEYGTWTTRLFDSHNKLLQVEIDKFRREHADDAAYKGKFGEIYAFVHVCVVGWDGVLDAETDKPIPFTKELAFEYLTDEDNAWLTHELIERSRDVRYYRGVTAAATKVEDAGN